MAGISPDGKRNWIIYTECNLSIELKRKILEYGDGFVYFCDSHKYLLDTLRFNGNWNKAEETKTKIDEIISSVEENYKGSLLSEYIE